MRLSAPLILAFVTGCTDNSVKSMAQEEHDGSDMVESVETRYPMRMKHRSLRRRRMTVEESTAFDTRRSRPAGRIRAAQRA